MKQWPRDKSFVICAPFCAACAWPQWCPMLVTCADCGACLALPINGFMDELGSPTRRGRPIQGLCLPCAIGYDRTHLPAHLATELSRWEDRLT